MVSLTKKDEKALKKSPGTTRWASYGSLCYISWFAKRAVHVLTNCYQPIAVDESGTIKHWFTDKGDKVQRKIARPPVVKYYNMYMGAVDMYDQCRSYIKLNLKTRKFWHPLFWLMIESAVVNAWLVCIGSRELALLPVEYTMFTVRKSIALALVSEWETDTVGCSHRKKKCKQKLLPDIT
jgi:Transposase IS4